MDRHYFDPSPLNLCVIQSILQSDRLGCPNEEIPIGHVSSKRIDFKPRHIPTDRNNLFNCDLVRCKGTGTDIFWLGPAKPIHVKERNAIFPFPESCPFFSESERKAGLIWKGRKGTGKERYDGPKFPFLSISDFPIWKTKFSISSKKVIKLGGHFLEFCITSNGRALVGALVGVMEGNFYPAELT